MTKDELGRRICVRLSINAFKYTGLCTECDQNTITVIDERDHIRRTFQRSALSVVEVLS